MTTPPSEDEYTTWRDDAVTAKVMAAVQKVAELQAEQWLSESWSSGNADQQRLITLRERAAAYRDLAALTHTQLVALLKETA